METPLEYQGPPSFESLHPYRPIPAVEIATPPPVEASVVCEPAPTADGVLEVGLSIGGRKGVTEPREVRLGDELRVHLPLHTPERMRYHSILVTLGETADCVLRFVPVWEAEGVLSTPLEGASTYNVLLAEGPAADDEMDYDGQVVLRKEHAPYRVELVGSHGETCWLVVDDDSPTFGFELELTNEKILSIPEDEYNSWERDFGDDYYSEEEGRIEQAAEAWRKILEGRLEAHGGALHPLEPEDQYYLVHLPDLFGGRGWTFDITRDLGAIEVRCSPLRAWEFDEIRDVLQELVFDSAAEAGLRPLPDPEQAHGSMHLHVGVRPALVDPSLMRHFLRTFVTFTTFACGTFCRNLVSAAPPLLFASLWDYQEWKSSGEGGTDVALDFHKEFQDRKSLLRVPSGERRKWHALNLCHLNTETDHALGVLPYSEYTETVEIRSLRAPTSGSQCRALVSLFDAKIRQIGWAIDASVRDDRLEGYFTGHEELVEIYDSLEWELSNAKEAAWGELREYVEQEWSLGVSPPKFFSRHVWQESWGLDVAGSFSDHIERLWRLYARVELAAFLGPIVMDADDEGTETVEIAALDLGELRGALDELVQLPPEEAGTGEKDGSDTEGSVNE